jgi:hypothetical protein
MRVGYAAEINIDRGLLYNGTDMNGEGFSVREAADRIRQKTATREKQRAERRERAKAWARKVALELGAVDPTLRRVYGFGSTFESWRNYREDSDIDLGIEGGNWSRLMGALPPSEFEVSIVELDLQNAEFTQHVREHGEVLYEKQ